MPKKNKKSKRSPHKNSPNRRSPNKGKNKGKQQKQNGTSANGSSNGSPQQSSQSSSSSSSPPSQLSPAMALKERGNVEFQQQRFKKAISLYSEAIALEPRNHTLFSNRSAAYKSSGQLAAALEDAKQCISLQPDWAKGYVRQGSVYLEQNQLDRAEASYKEGLAHCTDKSALRVCLSV